MQYTMQFHHLLLFLITASASFVAHALQSSFAGVALAHAKHSGSSTWTMRDRSASMAFSAGDQVQVNEDIVYRNMNLKHRQGVVVETWEKCEVDPTCRCAEQVDENMAVRVEFQQDENGTDAFTHYFGEDELTLVKKKNVIEAFDGMTCTAFKLEQLERNQKPRSIASFEPQKADDA